MAYVTGKLSEFIKFGNLIKSINSEYILLYGSYTTIEGEKTAQLVAFGQTEEGILLATRIPVDNIFDTSILIAPSVLSLILSSWKPILNHLRKTSGEKDADFPADLTFSRGTLSTAVLGIDNIDAGGKETEFKIKTENYPEEYIQQVKEQTSNLYHDTEPILTVNLPAKISYNVAAKLAELGKTVKSSPLFGSKISGTDFFPVWIGSSITGVIPISPIENDELDSIKNFIWNITDDEELATRNTPTIAVAS